MRQKFRKVLDCLLDWLVIVLTVIFVCIFFAIVVLTVVNGIRESFDPRGGWCVDHEVDKDGNKFPIFAICDSPLRPGR